MRNWRIAWLGVVGAALCGAAAAQTDYPAQAVKIIVQYPPGGAPDLVARTLAQKMGDSLGRPFLVENRAGGAGNIATDFVAKSPPDGYTLLLGSDGPLIINPFLSKLPYDTAKDFSPVVLAVSLAFYMLSGSALPASNIAELIALAKASPGRLNFASSGIGSQHHLAGELFNTLAGIKLVHVPYKGFGPTVTDVMSGKVEIMFGSPAVAIPYIKSGKLKALAYTGSKRFAGMTEVPTVIESGLPGYEISAWIGLLAPARTPQAVVERIYEEAAKALRSDDVTRRFTGMGLDIHASGPGEFAIRIRDDLVKWGNIVQQAGVKGE